MISSLSKLADKSFIVGFVLPTLLALIAVTTRFPQLPWLASVRAALAPGAAQKLDDLALVALTVWVLALLLSMTNYVQYRVLEGYLPPLQWCAWLKRYHVERFKQLKREQEKLEEVPFGEFESERNRRLKKLSTKTLTLLATYPADEAEILPTAFGNAIRAFEIYPSKVYRFSGIAGWIRLGAVIPRDFQMAVNDARSYVDFLVNVVFLAFGFSFMLLIRAIVAMVQCHDIKADTKDVLAFALGSALSYGSYVAAVYQVGTWGDLVKTCFDCYLPALAKQVGYTLPESLAERNGFWNAFNQLILFRDGYLLQQWSDAHPPPKAAPCRCVDSAGEINAEAALGGGPGTPSGTDPQTEKEASPN